MIVYSGTPGILVVWAAVAGVQRHLVSGASCRIIVYTFDRRTLN